MGSLTRDRGTRARRPIGPLAWLIGAAAAWLLRRPASTAFFKPLGYVRVPALIRVNA